MDVILNKLAEIETAASRIMEGTAAEKKQIEAEYKNRTDTYEQEQARLTDEKISRLKVKLAAETDSEKAALEQEAADKLAAMEADFEKTFLQASEDIFRRVIEV